MSYQPVNQKHIQLEYLRLALSEAGKCIPTPTAFCVGCVLVVCFTGKMPSILSTGFSRELPGNTHAEANALTKARQLSQEELRSLLPLDAPSDLTIDDILKCTDVYTTLEPCSIRTSGLPPCADALIASKVKRCFIGVGEPDDFVQCEGAKRLQEAGIEVVWLNDLEEQCLTVARRCHD
ncbi:hypothetical protein D9613_003106 [Agrocybe pediades]|uniref:CMP/dCMP-type deaminase domain-containing protein n=1 Tax=Agrocybe pediades TaxID=84607 RepID=A0A8H4QPG1_9AGAR|nr:hypothetical protein D9613_003106 [Agrocybe pediades]